MELIKNAVFSDMTGEYLEPCEPEKNASIEIRIRIARGNAESVSVVCNGEKYDMELEKSEGEFDYYQARYQLGERKLYYYFSLVVEGKVYFYDRRGISEAPNAYYDFCVIPGFHTPDWAKGAVMYQIFVDRFYNGDTSNDIKDKEYVYINDYVKKIEDWNCIPDKDDFRHFYGGDLQGVLDKLDYLSELGVDALYLNPIFVAPSNHKYDTQDYEHIDPHFGKIVKDTEAVLCDGKLENKEAAGYIQRTTDSANLEASDALFATLVKEAHKRGIRIILDGVFNHCGSFHKWLDREGIYANAKEKYETGAYWIKDSKYQDYFKFESSEYPNASYESWWGFDTLPKLNYDDSKELQNKILAVGKKWVKKPYCIDGWRLDVAADLAHSEEKNHDFWKAFRSAVKEENAEAIILAEHYGASRKWLGGDEWDTVMNYDAFMEPLTWFLTGMDKHSREQRPELRNDVKAFWDAMISAQANFTQPSLAISMNELSNHDHSRFLTRTNQKIGSTSYEAAVYAMDGVDKAVMREAVTVQMTWPGAPTIYYGDEAGVGGYTDPDNRRTYPWGAEDQEMLTFHKELIRIHKRYEALKLGSLKQVTELDGVLGYGRFYQKEHLLILLNNNEENNTVKANVWEIGIPKESVMNRLILSDEKGFTLEKVTYPVHEGVLEIDMPAKAALILEYIES